MAASINEPLLREGYLLKRQRGKSLNADLKKLKFQERYITLNKNALDYFDQKKGKKRGSFPIERIKIVEVVPCDTFGKSFCFQVGDEEEVMYFKAKSERKRKEWIEAFRVACVSIKKNEMCEWYHTGAFGMLNARWSCCCAEKRESKGCRRTTTKLTQRSRLASLSTQWEHSSTPVELHYKDKELSESVPTTTSDSATCNWGDEDFQDEIEYPQSPELEGEESEVKEKNPGCKDSGHNYEETVNSRGSPAKNTKRRSIDSGLDDVGVRTRAGSHSSNLSVKGFSLSPASYRRRKTQKQEVPSLVNAIFESDVSSSFGNPKELETKSRIVSSVFRGTHTLITASKNAYVDVWTDVTECASFQDPEQLSSTAVGSVSVWKNFLAVGFPHIQLVDLDTKEKKTLLSADPTKDNSVPQFVFFTPEGLLLSYKSASSTVHVWPLITSVWSNIDLPDNEIKSEPIILDGVQEIQSLSVSPDSDEPLIAVVVKSNRVDETQLRIYNFKTKELKQEIKLEGSASTPLAEFHPFDKYVAVGYGQRLLVYFIEKGSLLQLKNFDLSITSLCFYPTGFLLTLGLSSGEVKSYKGLPTAKDLVLVDSHSKPGRQEPASPTSLTYSKDCKFLSVGYSNGKVRLWQVPLISMLAMHTTHEVPLLRRQETSVTSEGAQFVSRDDGYMIVAPPGAVSEGSTLTLKHGVVPHGAFDQFEFPKGVYPVSAILSVQPTSKGTFLKPITIALPHFMNLETMDDCAKLTVLKACHVTDENGVPKYRFEEMPKKNLSLFSYRDKANGFVLPYVSYSSDHCCFWCVGTYDRSDTEKTMFCLTEANPKKPMEAVESREFHFCLSYYLPTCIKAITDQFPSTNYELKHLAVTFSDEKDAAISIQFEHPHYGWVITLQGGDKIHKKDLCFWDYATCKALVSMCENRQYPPRFILKVDGHKASKNGCMKVKFPGVKEYFKREIPTSDINLKLCPRLAVQHSTPRLSVVSVGSSAFTTRLAVGTPPPHPFQSAMAELTDVPPKKLAFYLFTNDVLTDDDVQSTKQSASEPNADLEELNMDTLMKAYQVLRNNPQKIQAICNALIKLNREKVAEKLKSDSEKYEEQRQTKWSRSGSAESSSSFVGGGYLSAHEHLSDPEVGTVAGETESTGEEGIHSHPEQSTFAYNNSVTQGHNWFSCMSLSNTVTTPFLSTSGPPGNENLILPVND